MATSEIYGTSGKYFRLLYKVVKAVDALQTDDRQNSEITNIQTFLSFF